jgi:hypothetical protein
MNTPQKKMSLAAWLGYFLVLVCATFAGCRTVAPDGVSAVKPADDGMMRGFAVPAWRKGEFRSHDYKRALGEIVALNSNWVSLHSTFQQDGMRGTQIFDTDQRGGSSPDIEEQRSAVQTAHMAGLKVLLKPHVNIRSGEGWRGDIGKGMTPGEVAAWFKAYDSLIVSHARLAEEEHVEMFAVGTELVSMDVHADEWRSTIAKVRAVYHGPIVYCANHSTENAITWWDALDYIGIDAYYPVSTTKNPSLDELKAAWGPYLKSCDALSKKFGKKILFTEIGYMATDGTSERPYDWAISNVYDAQEQADCYRAMFEKVYDKPWFGGMFLWNWDIRDSSDSRFRNGYSPKGKPAEAIVKAWYDGKK